MNAGRKRSVRCSVEAIKPETGVSPILWLRMHALTATMLASCVAPIAPIGPENVAPLEEQDVFRQLTTGAVLNRARRTTFVLHRHDHAVSMVETEEQGPLTATSDQQSVVDSIATADDYRGWTVVMTRTLVGAQRQEGTV